MNFCRKPVGEILMRCRLADQKEEDFLKSRSALFRNEKQLDFLSQTINSLSTKKCIRNRKIEPGKSSLIRFLCLNYLSAIKGIPQVVA